MDKNKIHEVIKLAKDATKDETEFRGEILNGVIVGLMLGAKHDTGSAADRSSVSPQPPAQTKPQSIKEFLFEHHTENDNEKALCFGYFMEHNQGKAVWTTADLIQCFKDAKEKVPANPSDKIFRCRSNGWIDAREDGYVLTNTGERVVAEMRNRKVSE
ncbi:MAG TPA: hypothetical protein VLJ21_01420 [Candidatus Binatia bacterium]|nr:hypothetical protein [Candidatus Binatia bacterium]